MSEDDAKKLGDAIAGVMKYHNVMMTPKQEAYALLFEAVASVYPPMLFTVYLRLKMEQEAKRKAQPQRPQTAKPAAPPAATPAPSNVTPIHQGQGTPAFDPFKIQVPEG